MITADEQIKIESSKKEAFAHRGDRVSVALTIEQWLSLTAMAREGCYAVASDGQVGFARISASYICDAMRVIAAAHAPSYPALAETLRISETKLAEIAG